MKMTVKLEIYAILVICSLLNIAICGECPVSIPTVNSVPNCPTTKAEMDEAAQRKKCELMADTNNCSGTPVYHCLLNRWRNETLEMCTSPWYISGYCAIYDTEMMKVVDDFTRDCAKDEECPTRYHSPEAYKYKKCYEKITNLKSSQTQTKPCNCAADTTGLIIVIVVLCVVIVCILVGFVLKYSGKLQSTGERKWPCFSNTRDSDIQRLRPDGNSLSNMKVTSADVPKTKKGSKNWSRFSNTRGSDIENQLNEGLLDRADEVIEQKLETTNIESNDSRQENHMEDSGREENRVESNLSTPQNTTENEQRFNTAGDNNGNKVDCTPIRPTKVTKAKFEIKVESGLQTSRDDSKIPTSQQNIEGVEEQTFGNAAMLDTKKKYAKRSTESESSNTERNDDNRSNKRKNSDTFPGSVESLTKDAGGKESSDADSDENVIKVDSREENSNKGRVESLTKDVGGKESSVAGRVESLTKDVGGKESPVAGKVESLTKDVGGKESPVAAEENETEIDDESTSQKKTKSLVMKRVEDIEKENVSP